MKKNVVKTCKPKEANFQGTARQPEIFSLNWLGIKQLDSLKFKQFIENIKLINKMQMEKAPVGIEIEPNCSQLFNPVHFRYTSIY